MRPRTSDESQTRPESHDAAGPSPVTDALGAAERADEGLHFGRAWHRYRFCYRAAAPLRVLDAGCGTGHSTAWAATLNPGARVLGIDPSPAALEGARRRTQAAGVGGAVDFRRHNPAEPIPEDWGRFDFVVCRGAVGRAADPPRLLANLARALDPAGLLMVSFPNRAGRQAAHTLRQAVDALAPPGAPADVRLALAREVFQSLLPDHHVRARVATPVDLDRLLVGYLDDRHDWTLGEAADMLDRAGLSFLYAATPWRWRSDRVFATAAVSERLRAVVDRLDPAHLSRLIDALDPTVHDDDFQLYACPATYTPPLPSWPTTRLAEPAAFDRLVPEPTGLTRVEVGRAVSNHGGRLAYRTVSGTPGEHDRISALLISSVDGTATCGEIEEKFLAQMRAGDDLNARQTRWIDLADAGLLLLRP